MKLSLIGMSSLLVVASAHAQAPAIDGTAEASYGDAIVTQAIGTGFGNASDAQKGVCNGSELDAAYAKVDTAAGMLYLVLAGNLQTNWNKLELFIDCKAGAGQNMLRSDNADVDYNGLNKMGADTVNALPGLKFDAGFAADFYFSCTIGQSGTGYQMHAVQAQLLTNGGGTGGYIGGSTTDATTGVILINDTVTGIQAAIDNSNAGGVDGSGGGASSGAGVRTGIELRIPLAMMGWDGTSPIKAVSFINGGGHDYASNQFLGAMPVGKTNLGGDGNGGYLGGSAAALRFDLSQIPGDQFFTIPTSSGPACPGDLDHDGVVGGSDLGAMLGAWGVCGASCSADLDHDGVVGGSDLGSLLGSWGACPR
jgi:hypothetical protein